MRSIIFVALAMAAQQATAEVSVEGINGYLCHTSGGFFDFSPANAIAKCRAEIETYCKGVGAPPIVGKVTGFPSGPARYARAEIKFECATPEDLSKRQTQKTEASSQLIRVEVAQSKKLCQEDFGFTPGTPEFGNCLLELQRQNFANRRAAKDVAAQDETDATRQQDRQAEADRATAAALQSTVDRLTPVTTNCSKNGSNITCTSR